MARLFKTEKHGRVIHLAAQAGVRHSIEHPKKYLGGNVTGLLKRFVEWYLSFYHPGAVVSAG